MTTTTPDYDYHILVAMTNPGVGADSFRRTSPLSKFKGHGVFLNHCTRRNINAHIAQLSGCTSSTHHQIDIGTELKVPYIISTYNLVISSTRTEDEMKFTRPQLSSVKDILRKTPCDMISMNHLVLCDI
jgi:hypothetical protein